MPIFLDTKTLVHPAAVNPTVFPHTFAANYPWRGDSTENCWVCQNRSYTPAMANSNT